MKFNKNDRVRYVGNETDNYFYPNYGTLGVIKKCLNDNTVEVIWDSGVNTDEIWTCETSSLEDVEMCPYCSKYSRMIYDNTNIKLKIIKSTLNVKCNDNLYNVRIYYCPMCGKPLKKYK